MTVPEPTAYVPKPGTFGVRRAQWAERTCRAALRAPDGLPPATQTFLRGLRRDLGRFKGSTFCPQTKWLWLVRIAADLGLEPYREQEPPGSVMP